MFPTCEIRWFFPTVPLDLEKHFDSGATPQVRTDWYAIPCDRRCGIKVREGRLETKLLARSHGRRTFRELSGHLESWTKWSLDFERNDHPTEDQLASAGWLAVEKRRLLQHFAIDGDRPPRMVSERPENGCEFELTEVRVAGKTWWTVGFEALGVPERLESNLERVAQHVARRGGWLCPFVPTCSFGYAHWLGQFVKRND